MENEKSMSCESDPLLQPAINVAGKAGHAHSISDRDREWRNRLRRLIFPVELLLLLHMFTILFLPQLYQQYFFQQLAKQTLDTVPNYTRTNSSFCLYQDYIVNYTSNETFRSIQHQANELNMYTEMLGYGCSVLASLVAGPISDIVGRKPVIFLTLFGMMVASVIELVIVHFSLSLYYFLATEAVVKLSGGLMTLLALCTAMVADTSSKRWWTIRMGIVESGIAFGRAASSVAANNWLQSSGCDFRPPSWLLAGTAAGSMLYLILVPESYTKEKRGDHSRLGNSFFSKLLTGFKLLALPSYISYSVFWKLWVGTVILTLGTMNITGMFQIQSYFLHNRPLQWTYDLIGMYGALTASVTGAVLVLVLPVMKLVGVPNMYIAMIGATVSGGAYFLIAMVRYNWEMFLAGVLAGMFVVIFPTVRSYLGLLVSKNDQGSLYCMTIAFQNFGTIFSTLLFNMVYHPEEGDDHLSYSLPFWIMGSIWLATIPLSLLLHIFKKEKVENDEKVKIEDDRSSSVVKRNCEPLQGSPMIPRSTA